MLLWACKNKRDDVIKTIVKLGTEMKDDVRKFWNHFCMTFIVLLMQLGQTLLHGAARYGRLDVVELLLANKADADASDKVGVVTIKY